ncbi:MAG: hypothetical protein ABJA87_00455 [bacterium]
MSADLAAGLATALLAGPWEPAPMQRRCREAVGRERTPRWLRQLVVEVLGYHHYPPRDALRELAALLPRFTRRGESGRISRQRLRVRSWTPAPSAMGTVPPAPGWPVTPLDDLFALARLLDVDAGELAWLADVRGMERDAAFPCATTG